MTSALALRLTGSAAISDTIINIPPSALAHVF
jgi:hypothetical protein